MIQYYRRLIGDEERVGMVNKRALWCLPGVAVSGRCLVQIARPQTGPLPMLNSRQSPDSTAQILCVVMSGPGMQQGELARKPGNRIESKMEWATIKD